MGCWEGKHGPYLIAEIGGNHEGSFKYAQRLTDLACKSGVDAVKYQIYTGDTLVNRIEEPERYAHFKRFELKPEEYILLAQQCRSNGVEFTASVWNMNALEWIDSYINFYKIGSGDLTAYPILKRIVSIGKPVILSTGLSTLAEIRATVNYIKSLDKCYENKEFLALLQCTSMYPIPDEDANLRVMDRLCKEFQLTVGYSDHTVGGDAVEVAVAMGAEIIEVHFTDTREGKSFRDHQVSFTCDELKELIEKIKKIKILQGKMNKAPTKSEIFSGHVISFRRAAYCKRKLRAGDILTEENMVLLRPANGIDARDYESIIGKRAKCDIGPLEKITWDMLL